MSIHHISLFNWAERGGEWVPIFQIGRQLFEAVPGGFQQIGGEAFLRVTEVEQLRIELELT